MRNDYKSMDYGKSHIAPYGKFLVKIWKEVTNITFGVIFYCFFCFFSKSSIFFR